MPEVTMPRLSDTMEEGTLSQWMKNVGDEVHKGDVLAEIETDKATMELEAYDEGVLEKILVEEGTTVAIGSPIAVIGTGDGAAAAPEPEKPAEKVAEPEVAAPRGAKPEDAKPETVKAEAAEAEAAKAEETKAGGAQAPAPAEPAAPDAKPGDGQIRTSPLARAMARKAGLDLATVQGSGPGGRIVRADVEAAISALEAREAKPAEAAQAPPAPARPTAPARPAAEAADVEEVPLTNVRRVTAKRLVESVQQAPHFYLTAVVDAEELLAFRAKANERLAATGTKVSVNDLIIKACAVALRAHPNVNASWGGDKILQHRRINIGVAVAVPDGLIVPVIHDADRMSVGEISEQARRLAEKARAGKLSLPEMEGGTFTVSNLGMYGVDHFTAVINPPQAAILAVGAAQPEAVVRDGQVVPRNTMKITLSIDHRVLDGATAAEFLKDLHDILEEPLRIVM